MTVNNRKQPYLLVDRERVMAEIRLPLGLQTFLEKEARRRNCTVNELIVHAVRADLEHRDLDLIRPNPTAPRKDPDKAQDRSEPPT